MSGTLRGSIEHVITNTAQAGLIDMWASLCRFFDSNPQMTRIASQVGGSGMTGSGNARMIGYYSDANHVGDNCFAVWRWNKANGSKVYVLAQMAYSSFGSSPGNPAVSSSSSSIGLQFAMDTSGGNPWNGTVLNNGADTKNASNVWVANGGDLLVWPRGNGPGGTGATIRQYCAGIPYPPSGGTRLHWMMDDDAFWYAVDLAGTGGYDCTGYFGPYIPNSAITITNPSAALIHIHNSGNEASDWAFTTAVGSTGGNTALEGGAVVQSTDGVRVCKLGVIPYLNTAIMEPNVYTSAFDVHEIFLRMEDATAPARYGLFGKLDQNLLAMVCNIPSYDTDVPKSKIIFGSVTQLHYKLLFPWNGVTVPGSGTQVTGVQF